MKNTLLITLFLFSLHLNSQNDLTINWINNNAIKIEDSNPDSELSIFNDNYPEKFANAKIFGFGEASHNGKEFFDIKGKFFKYLVKTQDVKVFIIEDQYQTEPKINEWISGGKGDIKTIINNFKIGFWKCREVANLLQWMRDYNLNKPREQQIRFYGMDIQMGENLNQEIRGFVEKYKIPVDEELLIVADSCTNKKTDFNTSSDFGDSQITKLKEIEDIILDFQTSHKENNNQEFISIIRTLNYLIKYTQYIKQPTTEVRDLKMFENVKWIVDKESKNGKAFIWAHNEHINKKEMNYSGSGIVTLGAHLKEYYKDNYYSVGFDFGIGELRGFVIEKNKSNYWKTYVLEKPFNKTYAETLFRANDDIYFVDMYRGLTSDSTNFFSTKNKHLLIAAGGYNPKPLYKIMVSKIYTEIYDGLIFVKRISPVTYF